MNSYHNQCRRGPARMDCRMPEVSREEDCCRMPEVPREKECCHMPEASKEKDCCFKREWPIGMTYVPIQEWKNIYQPDEGFHKGTIFAELDLPFLGRRMC